MQSNSTAIVNCQLCNYAQNSDEIIHVVLAVYDPSGTYSQHAGVVMTSIFENTKSKVTVHILHDDTLTEENRQRFIRTANKYGQSFELLDVTAYEEEIRSDKLNYACNRYSIGSLFRLLLPDILTTLDKTIYLDCDVLCGLDIADLWNVDISNYSLAGAKDLPDLHFNESIRAEKMRLLLNGCHPDTYINTGVLLMNLSRIRERGSLLRMGVNWLERRGEMALAADQDALNSIFAGDIKIIDSKFNQNVLIQDMSERIIHTLFGKPWHEMRGLQSDRIYWKMYLRSAWSENITPDELVDILNDAAMRSPMRSSKRNIFRRILSVIKHKIVGRIIPLRALHYIRIDMMMRFRNRFMRS